MTEHSVIGLTEVLKHYLKFRRLFHQLFAARAANASPTRSSAWISPGSTAALPTPSGNMLAPRADWFHDWNPKLIQYVSPQVWASREGRAYQMARDYDLVLSIFPFEKEWYAKRVPQLPVEFVGHPIVDRYGKRRGARGEGRGTQGTSTLLLLPGSRASELARHLPVMLAALELIRAKVAGPPRAHGSAERESRSSRRRPWACPPAWRSRPAACLKRWPKRTWRSPRPARSRPSALTSACRPWPSTRPPGAPGKSPGAS